MSDLINANGAPCPHCADLNDHLTEPYDRRGLTERYEAQVAEREDEVRSRLAPDLVYVPNDEGQPADGPVRGVSTPGKILAYLRVFR